MKAIPIKAVIFDLGNVLIGVDFDKAILQAGRHTPLNSDEIRQAVASTTLLQAYETGRLGTSDFCRAMIKLLKLDMKIADFASLWSDCFQRWPVMEKLFRELRQQLPVAILSNTSPLHWEFIAKAVPELSQADCIALSYELGRSKPEPRSYLMVAERLGINPQDCLFIDDLEVNVDGALKVGMQAFQFTTPQDARARIFSLR